MSCWDKRILTVGIILFVVVILLFGVYLIIPKIKLKGRTSVDIIYPDNFVDPGYTVDSLISGFYTGKVSVKSNVNNNKLGSYRIDYKTNFLFFNINKYRIVNIVDKTPPVFSLKGNSVKVICPNGQYEEEGYTAVDNYDGDITLNVKSINTTDAINYSVSDSSNNTTIGVRKIIREDKDAPNININGSNPKYVYVGSNYSEEGASASDSCDGDLTSKIKTEGGVDTSKVGSYTIKYSVTDSSNNANEVIRTVHVINKPDYSASTIYLTFDDGPSGNITPKILDILKEEGVKATFFVINSDDSLNYLIKRAFDEGHTVGLHTASHNYAKIYASEDAFFNDLNVIREKVKNITGEYTNIIRFPGGTSNTVSRSYNRGIMSRLSKEVLNRGFYYFDWNVSSGDAGGVTSASQVYNNVVNGLSSRRANVVLMHDSSQKTYTLGALRDIIRYGKEKGFSFDRLTSSSPAIRHNAAN